VVEGDSAKVSPTNGMLLCGLGGRYCAVPIEHVVETMRPLPIEPIPGAVEAALGVAIVRGIALPVLDAARLLGGTSTAPPGRFVTIRVGERHAVLAVETVLGVHQLPPSSLHGLPYLMHDAAGDVISKIGTLDARLLVVLRTMRVVPEALWRSLDTRAPS
jgi:purine-binding chemotaxis protein CheW